MTASTPLVIVPSDLAELPRWSVWRLEGGKDKVPYQLNGRRGDSTKPELWGELDDARRALASGGYTGLGFVFVKEDGLVGIDLDDSLEAGKLKPQFHNIVERFSDTYIEISPSCNGLKIWCRGSLPANLPKVKVQGGGIELYDHARYFTFTGRAFRGAPLEVTDHAADCLCLYEKLTARKPKPNLAPGRILCGDRHTTLVSVAGALRFRHVCEEAIIACLTTINRLQCAEPKTDAQIQQIVTSTRKWGEV
jgi:putative DNA primase/helicase